MPVTEVFTNEVAGYRLIPFRDCGGLIGVRSPTTLYKLVSSGALPEPIKRGSRSYFLERDIVAYVAKLAEQRDLIAQNAEREAGKQAAGRMLAGKLKKRAEAGRRKGVAS
jgi:predicted DNA-binding transcriptional regulator AlpA